MSASDLPLVNAILNGTCAVFLLLGFHFIRKGNRASHRRCMLTAMTLSGLFLLSYVIYHYQVGSVPFRGEGLIRTVYFGVLISHTLLAMTLPVLVPWTLTRALKERYARHKRLARITLPIWLYVSATGVIIYLMLYQLYPASPASL